MGFDKVLKRLRRERDMTQEQLAEYLNVSAQAVSKWETGLSLPDITLIPVLANIFEVSADVLLGVDVGRKERRIEEIVQRTRELEEKFNGTSLEWEWLEESERNLRAGLLEFPDSWHLMGRLISCLFNLVENRSGVGKAAMNEEIVRIGEKILAECSDDHRRNHAIHILCRTYAYMGERQKAVKLAGKMPPAVFARERLLEFVELELEGRGKK